MMQHRQKVCPTFAEVVLDHAAADRLPQAAVPDVVIQAAQSMAEATSVQIVIQRPASRIPMFCRPEKEQSDGSEDERNSNDGCVDPHHAATLGTSASPPEGGDPHPTKADDLLPSEPLNENDVIIGIDEEAARGRSNLRRGTQAWRN